jgi:hypothetical protein
VVGVLVMTDFFHCGMSLSLRRGQFSLKGSHHRKEVEFFYKGNRIFCLGGRVSI